MKPSHMVAHIFIDSQVFKRYRRDLLTNIVSLICGFKNRKNKKSN